MGKARTIFVVGIIQASMYCTWNILSNDIGGSANGGKVFMIDWEFIASLEGKRVLTGYVPISNGEVIGNSGVTIATGFDLGQQSVNSLQQLLYSELDILSKLHPYVGLKKWDAINKLRKYPLTITEDEAIKIDLKVKELYHDKIKASWDAHSITNFDLLPNAFQTILFSLGYNFGPWLHKSLPQTFRIALAAAESGNFGRLANWLDVFPSKQPELEKRRKKEAAYLRNMLSVPH